MEPAVDVYLGEDPRLVGRARFSMRRGQVSTAFAYDDSYLAWADAFAIDPALPLSSHAGFVAGLPGAFGDAASDRWGRRPSESAFGLDFWECAQPRVFPQNRGSG